MDMIAQPSRNNLHVGSRVYFWGGPRALDASDIGTVREFTTLPVSHHEYHGCVTHYLGARVEWCDGQSAWLSTLDLHEAV